MNYRLDYNFSDLDISDPGTVRVSNSFDYDRQQEQLDSIQDSNSEPSPDNDWQMRSSSSRQTLAQDPHSINYDDDYIGQERISNSEELKCVLDEVNCMICFHLVQEPVICVICEALFCKKCIYEWFIKSPHRQDCPCCRTDSGEYYDNNHFNIHNNNMVEFFKNQPSIITAKVPLILKKILSKIQLKCLYQEKGCQEIVSYDYREKHEKYRCEYTKVGCTNIDCDEIFMRKDLIDHGKLCPYGQVQCRYCDQQVLRSDYDIHAEQCDYRLQNCRWCNNKQFVYEIIIHEHECPLKQVCCSICHETFNQERFLVHTPEFCWRLLCHQSRDNELKLHKKLIKMDEEAKQLKEENKMFKEENKRLKVFQYLNMYDKQERQNKDPEYKLEFEEYDDDMEMDGTIEEVIEAMEQDPKVNAEVDEYKSNPSFSVTASTISCITEVFKQKNQPAEQIKRLKELERDLFQLLKGV